MMDRMQTNHAGQSRAEGAGVYITLILQTAAFMAPLIAVYAPLGMAPLMLAAAVAIVGAAVIDRRRVPVVGRPLLMLLATLVAWSFLSGRWSVNPIGSVAASFQLLGLFAAGAVVLGGAALLDGRETARIGRALAIGLVGALAIYTVEMVLNSPIQSLLRQRAEGLERIYSPFNRGLAVMVLLLAPAVIALRRLGYAPLAGLVLAAAVAIVYVYYGSSVAVALVAAFIAAVLSYFGRGAMTRLTGWIMAALVLLAPFAVERILTPAAVERIAARTDNMSVSHRLIIWDFVAEKALEHPYRGWGLDAARVFPGGQAMADAHSKTCQPPCAAQVQVLPLHPHNMALQWWLELGLPGAAIGAAVLFWLFHQIPRLTGDPAEEALLVGQLTVAIGVAALSYGAWQSWWISTLVIALAMTRVCVRIVPEQPKVI